MREGIMKVLFFVLAILIVITVFSRIYSEVNQEYKTETAVIYSSADKISFKGVFIRDEEVIRKTYTGVLSYPIADGSKVANGSVVAYVYGSEDEIAVNRKIESLKDEIFLLEAAQNPGTVLTAQPEFIASLISENYQALSTSLAKKDLSSIKSQRDQLLTLMGIYQISVDKETDYNARITELAAQVSDLNKQKKNYRSVVTSPDAGYFVSYTDGYEGSLKTEEADSLTAEKIIEVIENERTVSANRSKAEIGKLVKGYDWKLAGVIDNSDSVYNPGDSVKLSFTSTPDTVNAVIESLEPSDDPTQWTVVLRCEEMTFDLVRKRVERVEMTLNDFEGIKVPRAALRFNKNNEKGCYVLWGQRVLFKKVDPIFEDEDYMLSRITSDESYVCVYDDIIIDGVDTAAFMANSDEVVTAGIPDEEETAVYTRAETTAAVTTAPPETENGDEEAPSTTAPPAEETEEMSFE